MGRGDGWMGEVGSGWAGEGGSWGRSGPFINRPLMLEESDLWGLRTTTDMSTTAAALLGTSNLSEPCGQLGVGDVDNRSLAQRPAPDARRWLFSLLPYTDAVPALILVLCALTAVSLSVNALTLLGLRKADDQSWERRFTLFRNLVLNDLLQTLLFAPSVIHALMQRRTVAFNAWCHVQHFAGTVMLFNSLLTVTLMAVERYVFVCHAIHYLVLLTRARLWLALGLTWLFSLRMYQDAAKAMLPIRAVNTAARKTVLFYLGMLMLQLLPLFVKVLSDAVWELVPQSRKAGGAQHGPTAAVLHLSLVVATLVPPCVNPLVFGIRNAEMRRALLTPLRRLSERWADWRSRAQE